MYKRFILIASVCLSIALNTTAQEKVTLSLEDCISYAKEHNMTLKRAKLNAQSAEEDVKGAKAALLPSVSASTNQSLGYRPWQDNAITVTNGIVDDKEVKWYYNGTYGINANWTLWDGNKNRNTIKQNKLTAKQKDLEVEVTANSIEEQITQLYIQILYLEEAVKVSQQSLETSKKNEERGKQMLEVGKMSKADVAQLTAQRATDEFSIVQSQTNIRKYKLQLKELLEMVGPTEIDIVVPATTDEQAMEEVPALQAVYENALAARPELAEAKLQIESSELSVKMAKAGYLPTLGMTAGFGTSTNSRSDDTWGSQMKTNFDMSAGLTLSIPIYDRRQTKTAIRKARIQQELAQVELEDAEDQLYATIEGYWLDATLNQEKLRAAQVSVDSEQESFNLLQEQFQLGLKNIVELMTGKDRLLKAQQDRLESKYLAIMALKMLKFYQRKGEL